MQLYLTSVTLKGQYQGHSDIEGLYFSVQCHFGVVRCTCLNMAYNSKTFDLLVIMVIWRSFRALVSKWLVTCKWLAVELSGVIFGIRA